MKSSNGQRKVSLWGGLVASLLIVAGFLIPNVPVIGTAATSSIDLSAPASGEACGPCHVSFVEVNVPGLNFSHGNHLLVSCDGCHLRMPHRDGVTERVPMQVCFACHGVQHGSKGELAKSECRDCHTESHVLRPATHTKKWAEKPHADAANSGGINACMMCHDAPKDCDHCHREQDVDIAPIPNVYHSVVQPMPSGPTVEIYPDAPVSMSQCVYCHPDLDAIPPARLTFLHGPHLERNYRCDSCHDSFAHDQQGTKKPDMISCYRCHDVYHSAGGLIADGQDCYTCHPESFALKPPDHTKAFVKRGHKKSAKSNPESCSMCHISQFCVDCHSGKGKSPSAPDKPVIPSTHKKAKWRVKHGGLYLQGEGACGICHDGPSCQRCHQTVVPHPPGWGDRHRLSKGVTNSDCNVCHTDRSGCQQCHHQSVKSAALVAKNCVKCHPEMRTKPPTSIKIAGLAEHAVHFGVAKKKGKPYLCDDCHISVGRVGIRLQTGPTGPHDMRICYDCHGSLDLRNMMIAPWPGSDLCRRCHTDLKL